MANNGIYYSSGNSLNFTTNSTTWATLGSGGTFVINTVSGGTYLNLPSATFTGGTVTGPTDFTNGLTANTISATTYQNLPYTGTVTGTGTTNYVPVWLSSTGLGNSIIQSNGNEIGVGVSPSPSYLASFYTTGTTGIFSQADVAAGIGVEGQGGSGGYGVRGQSGAAGYGIYGINTGGGGGGWGVYGESNNGIGVHGKSYGDTGPNIAVRGESDIDSSGTPENIGGYFSAVNGGTNYSLQLTDGTEGVGKVLVSQTSDGKSNWSDSLTGLTSISATTYFNLPVSGITAGTGIGVSSSNGNYTISYTGSSGTSGDYLPLSGGTVTGGTIFTSGITANTLSSIDYIDFDLLSGGTAASSVSRLRYVADEGGLVTTLLGGNVDLQIGQQNVVFCYNGDTVNLTKGQVVAIFGNQGNRPKVQRAIASAETTSSTALGVVSETINVGNEGFITTFGNVRGFNLTGITPGSYVYLSPTVLGGFTGTQPQAPDHIVAVGYVVRTGTTQGEIFVNINNGWELNELHNVRITNPSQYDILQYSAGTSPVWYNTSSPFFSGLTATTISAATYLNYPGSSSANCFTTFYVTNISGCSPVNVLSPLNVQDGLSVTGTSTFTSQANFTGGISATTFSASTFQNLPVSAVTNGTGISTSTTNGVVTVTNTDLGSSQNIFKNIQVDGVTQFSAGSNSSNLNFSGINITITSAATNTLVFSAGTGGVSGNFLPTSGGTITGNLIVTGDTNVSGTTTTTGNVISLQNLQSLYSVGDEGGEITLAKPATNSTISGTSVTIDIYQNKLRFFESGGSNRGAYIDLTQGSSSAGSNLLSGGTGGGVTSVTAGTGLSGDTTTGSVNLQLSASSYSMFVNNTASAAAPSQVTYKDTGDASFSSIVTWATTTPSPTAGDYRYRWTQIGNIVWFYFNWTSVSLGAGAISWSMPSDMPNPAIPTGFNVANYALHRYTCSFGSTVGGPTSATITLAGTTLLVLRRNSANTAWEWIINSTATIRWFSATGHYFV